MFRLSRIRGKVAYATKAEHDFKRPADFDPRDYANRADWQFGDDDRRRPRSGSRERIAWQVERHFGRFGTVEPARRRLDHAAHRLRQRAPARRLVLRARRARASRRAAGARAPRSSGGSRCSSTATTSELELARPSRRARHARCRGEPPQAESRKRETAIRPERFARLVTLASILIEAGRAGRTLAAADVCEQLQISDAELREDVNVLNVVNFGGGSYVLYAEVADDGTIEVDPEPYSDNFARPARLLPVEAKALVAAIDLIGDHLPAGSLTSARDKIVAALGSDPMEQGLQIAGAAGDDTEIARVVSARDRRPAAAAARVLQAQRGPALRARRRAVRADQRP